MTLAIVVAEPISCPACQGSGYQDLTLPCGEIVPRYCELCCYYGTLDGGRYERWGERTAGFRKLQRWRHG